MKPTAFTLCMEFNWSPGGEVVAHSGRDCAQVACANVLLCYSPAHYHCNPTKFDQLNPQNIAFIATCT